MAKNKKEKIQKKQTGPKPKWRYWMTVLGVVGGVTLVSGATVLGVFLTGGFEEKIIHPENIAFEYDEDLFNEKYTQLEITNSDQDDEFELVINTTTEEVTEKKVRLFFNNLVEKNTITTTDEYVANTIIQAPRYVTIGQPFKVKLLNEIIEVDMDNDGVVEQVDWIKGGVSTLYAESQDGEIETSVKIAVDTPIYATQAVAYDSNGDEINLTEFTYEKNGKSFTDNVYEVLAGESFYVGTKFIPAKSEYMYADDSEVNEISEENRRKKHSFFAAGLGEGQANAIVPQYDGMFDMHFLASTKKYGEPIAFNAYTFIYADKEEAFVENPENQEREPLEFYRTAITTLEGDSSNAYKQQGKVKIGEASIGDFAISNRTTLNLVRGKNTKLYLRGNSDEQESNYLGATILSNTETPRALDTMLQNIGIRFTYTKQGVTNDAVQRTGYENGIISLPNSKSIVYNGNYYYLPYTGVSNVSKGYWDIHAIQVDTAEAPDQEIAMEIVLFKSIDQKDIDEGNIHLFQKVAGTDYVIEEKAGLVTDRESYTIFWADTTALSVNLDYNEEIKDFDDETINLKSLINGPTNLDYVFFADFGAIAADADGGINKVLGPASYETMAKIKLPDGQRDVYVINGTTITLQNTGEFKLYFASVNKQYDVEDDRFIETWPNKEGVLPYKNISCQKSLYGGSVTGAMLTLPTDAQDKWEAAGNVGDAPSYYAYIGAKDAAKNTFNVELAIAADSYKSFRDAFANNEKFTIRLYNENDVPIAGTNEEEQAAGITDYFELLSANIVDLKEEAGKAWVEGSTQYVLRATYRIYENKDITSGVKVPIDRNDDETIDANEYFDNQTLRVKRAELLYDKEDDKETELSWGSKENTAFDFAKELYVYNAIAETIEVTASVGAATIDVTQTLVNNAFKTTIAGYDKIKDLIEDMATTVVIKDLYGNTESLEGKWKFTTNNSEAIVLGDRAQDFTFGTAQGEATVSIYTTDGLYSGKTYTFSLSTVGIQSIKVDGNLCTDKDGNLVTNAALKEVAGITSIIERNLADIVKYYTDKNGTTEYTPADALTTYELSALTTSPLTEKQKKDLFGVAYIDEDGNIVEVRKGAVSLYGKDGKLVYAIVDESYVIKDADGNLSVADDVEVTGMTANSSNVAKFVVNDDFAKDADLVFNITATGINVTLTVKIKATVQLLGNTQYTIYAGAEYTPDDIDNDIRNNVGETKLLDYYDGTFYIYADGEKYYLTEAAIPANLRVATLTSGAVAGDSKLEFADFWENESKTFVVHFAPKGDSAYDPQMDITFTVLRNLKIEANADNMTGNKVAVTKSTACNEYYSIYPGDKKEVANYIKLGRIKGTKALSGFTYSTATGGYLDFNASNNQINRSAQDILFKHNNVVQDEKTAISVKYGGITLATIQLKVKVADNIYASVANALTLAKYDGVKKVTLASGKVQQIDGTNYIYIDIAQGKDGWTWTGSDFAGTGASLLNQNYEGEATKLYAVQSGGTTVNFRNSGALYGYNSSYYMIVRTANPYGSVEWIYLPLIVSSVGTKPVEYANVGQKTINSQDGKADRITDYASRYIDVALMTPDELIANQIYDEFYAGQDDIELSALHFNKDKDSVSVALYNGAGATNAQITNKLLKGAPSISEGKVKISLYNLADNIEGDFYVAFRYTMTVGVGYKQEFYYVIKVLPNVHADKSLYPYDGQYENLKETSGTINLDETFASSTLHYGEQRFNVVNIANVPQGTTAVVDYAASKPVTLRNISSGAQIKFEITKHSTDYSYIYTQKYSGTAVEISGAAIASLLGATLDNGDKVKVSLIKGYAEIEYDGSTIIKVTKVTGLSYIDEVVEVEVNGTKVYTKAEQWNKFISISIKEGILKYQVVRSDEEGSLATDSIKFTIKRTYVNANDSSIESVINGSQEYVFAVNDTSKNYSIRIEQKDGQFLLTGEEGATSKTTPFRNGKEDVNIGVTVVGGKTIYSSKIILVENAEAGNSSTGTEVYNVANVELSAVRGDTNARANTNVVYNRENGDFTVTLPPYIEQDTQFEFAIFTTYGHIASLVLDVKANVVVTINQASVTGGTTYALTSLFNVDTGSLTISSFAIDDEFINAELDEQRKTEYEEMKKYLSTSANSISVSDTTSSHTFNAVPFKITFTNGAVYRFTKDIVIVANVEAEALDAAKQIAKKDDTAQTVGNFFKTGKAPTGKVNLAVAEADTNALLTLGGEYNEVDSSKDITIKIGEVSTMTSAKFTLRFTLNSGETVDVRYEAEVYPAVQMTTSYPNPTGEEELDYEYIANATEATIKLELFTGDKAVFANENRITIKGAEIDADGNVKYTAAAPAGTATITFAGDGPYAAVNAKLTIGGVAVGGDQAVTGETVKFERQGSNDNAESKVTFNVTYCGVTIPYTFYISNNLWQLSANIATNNKVSGTYPEEEVKGTYTAASDLTNETVAFSAISLATDKLTNGDKMQIIIANGEGTFKYNGSEITLTEKDGELVGTFDYDSSKLSFIIPSAEMGATYEIRRVQTYQESVEKIYVDRIKTTDLFVTDRMAEIGVTALAESDEYYMIFKEDDNLVKEYAAAGTYEMITGAPHGAQIRVWFSSGKGKVTYNGETLDEGEEYQMFTQAGGHDVWTITTTQPNSVVSFEIQRFYASYAINIKSTEAGQTKIVDLGISMSGKEYCGIYKTSVLDMLKPIFEDDGLIKINVAAEGAAADWQPITREKLDSLASVAIINPASVKLKNRIQLYYGAGTIANMHEVDHSKFAITNGNASGEEGKISVMNVKAYIGATVVPNLSYDYFYLPSVDIQISSAAEANGMLNTIQLEANKEYTSLSQLFGLTHPSSGKYLSAEDGNNVDITFEVVNDVNAQTTWAYYNLYKTQYGPEEATFFKSVTDTNKQYLFYVPHYNSDGNEYDFHLLPQGAKNEGDYVLTKVTYKIDIDKNPATTDDCFTKEFYVVINIVPDYVVSYGGSSEASSEETIDGKLMTTNINSIIEYENVLETNSVYYPFSMIGSYSTTVDGSSVMIKPYVNIRHKNGGSTADVAPTAFKISMPRDVDNKYNITENIVSKLGVAAADVAELTSGEMKAMFETAEEVVFGDQYYFIEGEDEFGYKFRSYFILGSTALVPSVAEELVVNELRAFDIGVQYQKLTVNESGSNATISAKPENPDKNSAFELITLTGINAWMFSNDFSEYTVNKTATGKSLSKSNEYTGSYVIPQFAGEIDLPERVVTTAEGFGDNTTVNVSVSSASLGLQYNGVTITLTDEDENSVYEGSFTYVSEVTTFTITGTPVVGDKIDFSIWSESLGDYITADYVIAIDFEQEIPAEVLSHTNDTEEILVEIKSAQENVGITYNGAAVTLTDKKGSFAYVDGVDTFTITGNPAGGDKIIFRTPTTTSSLNIDESSMKYLEVPDLKYIKIKGLTLTYRDGSPVKDADGNAITVLGPDVSGGYDKFYTNSSVSWKQEGVDADDNINLPGYGASTQTDRDDNLRCWSIPRLPGDVFGGANSAQLQLIIKLEYRNGTNVEIYNCPVNVVVNKEIKIEENGSGIVYDGQDIDVSEQFVFTASGTGVTPTVFYNDTLEVLVAENATGKFSMRLYEGATQIGGPVSVSLPNSGTQYLSLSQYFGMNLHDGYNVKIATGSQGIDAFYYNGAKVEEENAVDIAAITKDRIYIENQNLILSGNYQVTKHYIAECNIGGQDYYYRAARKYTVKGVYSDFVPAAGTVLYTIKRGETELEYEDWAAGAFELTANIGQTIPTYLKFEIMKDDDGAVLGVATLEGSKLKLSRELADGEYIKVAVYMAVSGTDRNIATAGVGEVNNYLKLGEINLANKPAAAAAI